MKTLIAASTVEAVDELAALLRQRGHEVAIATGLERAVEESERVERDLIVVALGADAELTAACHELRTRAAGSPSVLVVLEGEGKDPLTAVIAGATDFVSNQRELVARLCLAERGVRLRRSWGALVSERQVFMGSLAACIAHEINNPLTYVISNLSYAARGLSELMQPDDPSRTLRLEMAIADAREGVERIRRIVSDLSVLSRPEEDEHTIVDLRRVLESSINVASNEIRHRARLEKEYGTIPSVRANEVRLGQVFLNLLLGCVRTIPEGAAADHTISVLAGTDDESGRAVVEIRDVRARFPEGPVHGDTLGEDSAENGLGVAISEAIVVGLGGELIVDAYGSPGFRVLLPACEGLPSSEAKIAAEAPAKLSGRARILVVDDEPVIAATMRRALEAHDMYVVTSGRDALELCRAMEFDLVLCDLMMPDLTGMDLYEELQRDEGGLEKRIIFMTGGAFTERARRFLGTVPWVEKPFDADEIQAVVGRYFGLAQPETEAR